MKRISRTGIVTLIATALMAGTLAFAAPSGAATGTVSFTNPRVGFKEDSILIVALLSGGGCSADIAANEITLTFGGAATTVPVVQTDPGFFGKYQFSFTIPSGMATVPGQSNDLGVSVTCNVSSTPTTFTGTFSWSQIDVTKVVEGDGPAGAAYPISVDCSMSPTSAGSTGPTIAGAGTSFQFTLAAGATKSLFSTENALCTVTEVDSLGATSNSPITIDVTDRFVYPAVITNSYAAAPSFTG